MFLLFKGQTTTPPATTGVYNICCHRHWW